MSGESDMTSIGVSGSSVVAMSGNFRPTLTDSQKRNIPTHVPILSESIPIADVIVGATKNLHAGVICGAVAGILIGIGLGILIGGTLGIAVGILGGISLGAIGFAIALVFTWRNIL
jgi:hypothetical protein